VNAPTSRDVDLRVTPPERGDAVMRAGLAG
jgi:hypothetical protein